MSSLISLGRKAKEASYILGNLSSKDYMLWQIFLLKILK